MFGFVLSKEERTLVGAASVLDFDLELEAGEAIETPATAAAPGFQTVDLKETVNAEKVAEQMEAAAASPAPAMCGGDISEAFLVNGSLSGGLQSVQQQNFFDQLDNDQSPVKKPKKGKAADLGPGAKRAKKAAKKAKKKKSVGDTVSSFGATGRCAASA